MRKIEFRKKSNRRLTTRFTLIEILVVVAIIGILASFLLPTLSKARKKARIAVCTSNQKQINSALLMFTDDNDGYVPKPSGNPDVSWDDHLSGYDGRETLTDAQKTARSLAKSTFGDDYGQLYRCPLFEDTTTANVEMSYATSRFTAPEPNTQWFTGQGVMGFGYAANLSDVTVPNESIMLFDYNRSSNFTRMGRNVDNVVRATDLRNFETLQSDGMMHDFYEVNYLFVDGHVESLDFNATLAPYGANYWRSNGSMWDAYK
ncbi:hypothetical protein LNTAR_25130 [Lentisphaera araneosa HTCC2155]|uniref:Prepilin-type N-terminal cleavage/methylation domain-containing protein n=1 Tax=Lentisphaera araneosa HTCC2155 TaxID=313628 RepID=A6DRV3_9BACT|nr:prepilin-type N-terminal cleavage/methylation domain-containing protein [Lentisphaera araneosa]EDM25638.1 hypothetical protein LNTAR_25130 [Lentisphaera araneosa HTCC2155]